MGTVVSGMLGEVGSGDAPVGVSPAVPDDGIGRSIPCEYTLDGGGVTCGPSGVAAGGTGVGWTISTSSARPAEGGGVSDGGRGRSALDAVGRGSSAPVDPTGPGIAGGGAMREGLVKGDGSAKGAGS